MFSTAKHAMCHEVSHGSQKDSVTQTRP
jgi:hypothetical protein